MTSTSRHTPIVAYFCMEYGLHESFPIYSGGLGILAGDYIKAAHDLAAGPFSARAIAAQWAGAYAAMMVRQ